MHVYVMFDIGIAAPHHSLGRVLLCCSMSLIYIIFNKPICVADSVYLVVYQKLHTFHGCLRPSTLFIKQMLYHQHHISITYSFNGYSSSTFWGFHSSMQIKLKKDSKLVWHFESSMLFNNQMLWWNQMREVWRNSRTTFCIWSNKTFVIWAKSTKRSKYRNKRIEERNVPLSDDA